MSTEKYKAFKAWFQENPKLIGTGVYRWRNLKNNKVYIGSTSESFLSRKWSHLRELERNNHANDYFQKAWNKSGKENFVFEIVEECVPSLVLDCEQDYLDDLDIPNPDVSYNLSPTAGSNAGIIYSEEARAKFSKANSTPEMRQLKSELSRKMWEDPDHREKVIPLLRVAAAKPEVKAKIRKALEEKWKDPEYRAKLAELGRERFSNPEERLKVSIFMKEYMNRPEIRKQVSERFIEFWSKPENRKRMSEIHAELWKDEALREKRIASMNTPEVTTRRNQVRSTDNYRQLRSLIAKRTWADPEIRIKRIESLKKSRKKKLDEQDQI